MSLDIHLMERTEETGNQKAWTILVEVNVPQLNQTLRSEFSGNGMGSSASQVLIYLSVTK